jgi:hypothetical protein
MKIKVFDTLLKTFNKLERSNNLQNIVAYNENYNLIKKRLLNNISTNTQTENQPTERLFSNIEVMNEFNYIKKDLVFYIFYNKLHKYLASYPVLNVVIPTILTKFSFIYNWIGSHYGLILLLEDYMDVKKLENYSKLRNSIKDGNYNEALDCLSFFKEEDVDSLFEGLRKTLKVMAKKEVQMKFFENLS